jgi:hypothetical protein
VRFIFALLLFCWPYYPRFRPQSEMHVGCPGSLTPYADRGILKSYRKRHRRVSETEAEAGRRQAHSLPHSIALTRPSHAKA